MLTRLCLRDYVLAELVEFEPEAGFCVLTGETGAGKSLLVGALSLLAGGRGGANLVRPTAKQAEIEAVFSLDEENSGGAASASAVRDWLNAAGLSDDDGGELIVRRVIGAKGSKAYLNGRQATLMQMAEVVGLLTEICGQHAHYSLRQGESQRTLFDQYSGADAATTAAAFKQWTQADKAWQAADAAQAEQSRQRDMLTEQLAELDVLSFDERKWGEMNDVLTKMANLSDISESANRALDLLDGDDSSARAALLGAIRALQAIEKHDAAAAAADMAATLLDASGLIDDVARTLNAYNDGLRPDDAALAAAEAFIGECHRLARKYGLVDAAQLGAHIEDKRRELASLSSAEDLQQLDTARQAARQSLDAALAAMTAARRAAAPKFATQVNDLLGKLGMAKAKFSVSLASLPTPTAHGGEKVTFQLATRAGRAAGDIADIASGGELSRLGLAVQIVAGRTQSRAVSVFDEVDAGIGGATADVVGRLLKSLGRRGQVLCVTHLPQVAAYADAHWRIGGADMRAERLSMAGRVEELARMHGGSKITATGRRHAQEMLNAAEAT